MRIVRYQEGAQARLGLWLHEGIFDIESLAASLPDDAAGLQAALTAWLASYPSTDWEAIRRLASWIVTNPKTNRISPETIHYLPPVPNPGKIICVGMNYPGTDPGTPQTYPTLFLKAASTLTGHMQPVVIPEICERVFGEVELVVVIGKRGKRIPPQDAAAYIAGYTIANDVGALDLEARTSQWQTGKLPDTFLPIGPALVPTDEVDDISNLHIQLSINDVTVLDDRTGSMIFDIHTLIAYISSIATLHPGDLILTGSPKMRDPGGADRAYIHLGDSVEARIDLIGVLTNPITKE